MTMTNQLETPLYENLVAKFEIAEMQAGNEHLKALRNKAFGIFKQLGFPSIKNEEWRFTNVLPIVKENYELEVVDNGLSPEEFEKTAALVAAHTEEIQQSLKGEHKGAYRLVIVNGKINERLSYLPNTQLIEVLSFEQAENKASFQKYFGNVATMEGNAFTALNTALYKDGLFVEVPANAQVDKPLHLINVFVSAADVLLQPRHLFVVNKNASLEIIETILADQTGHNLLVNGVTEISVAENAHFHHYDIQTGRSGMRYIQRTEASQQKHSNYSNYTFTFPGADFVRNNLTLHLDADTLESHLYGLYLTAGTQLVDNHTEVHHKFPNGESNQLYKGVLMDKSKAVFNGKIYVYQDAQKTNAFQQSNNILFSDKATVNAKPQLEIFADDVKCSHGTTIGQMNKEALFYLQSRGIGEASARNLLVNAFAFDVTEKVKIPAIRTYLEKTIAAVMNNAE
ncbi:MAG: Fe-S cluster assembly protein SufD [Edaphocola sp.]